MKSAVETSSCECIVCINRLRLGSCRSMNGIGWFASLQFTVRWALSFTSLRWRALRVGVFNPDSSGVPSVPSRQVPSRPPTTISKTSATRWRHAGLPMQDFGPSQRERVPSLHMVPFSSVFRVPLPSHQCP